MSGAPILIATDLDRTLLPNGAQPESPEARPRFRRFVARPEVRLVYVTGRHLSLVEEAMREYDLPKPDFVIGDVGTSLYRLDGGTLLPDAAWRDAIGQDWAGYTHDELAKALLGIDGLTMQEPEKQAPFKLSYYAEALTEPYDLLAEVRACLAATGARCNVIWSVDETSATGLLDILPASASKLHALEFLRAQLGIPLTHTVFAGDSGNDMEILVSEIPAVLVANAQPNVRAEAVNGATANRLYLAQGGFAGMNGNYSAGILEGIAHFIPSMRCLIEAA